NITIDNTLDHIKFDYTELTGNENRNATITIKANVAGQIVTKTLKMTQTAKEHYFELVQDSWATSSAACNASFPYVIDAGSSIESAVSDESWVNALSYAAGNLFAHIDANNTGADRKATIKVLAKVGGGYVSRYLTIKQAAGSNYFELATDYMVVDMDPQQTCSIPFFIEGGSILSAESGEAWIHDIQTNATDVSFNVDDIMGASTRKGTITIKANVAGQIVTRTIIVFQPATGTYFDLPFDSISVSAKGTVAAEIKPIIAGYANVESVQSGDDWITAKVDTSGNITYDIDPLTSGGSRVGAIKVIAIVDGKLVSKTIIVLQSDKDTYFELAKETVTVDYKNQIGDVLFFKEDNVSILSVVSDASWLTTGMDYVHEDASVIRFEVDENTSSEARTGTITITSRINGAIVTKTIIVKQEATIVMITNATELKDVIENQLVNGGLFRLDADIDMTGVDFDNSVNPMKDFTIDGNGHTITGLKKAMLDGVS
ncbi:MAG: BACON domain-containing protein, partial [Bacteroidales bacterium]|nr:BACON domain-containing protein [Bacteroidales bacterium]